MISEQPSPFRTFIQQLSGITGTLVTYLLNKQNQKAKALDAISEALEKTYLHYKRRDEGILYDSDRQEELIGLWRKAANAMSFVDPELAETCRMKFQYWLNPNQYSHSEVSRITMDLDRVNEQYRKLLSPSIVKKEERAKKRKP